MIENWSLIFNVSSYSHLLVCGRPEEEDSRMSVLFSKGAIQNLRESVCLQEYVSSVLSDFPT